MPDFGGEAGEEDRRDHDGEPDVETASAKAGPPLVREEDERGAEIQYPLGRLRVRCAQERLLKEREGDTEHVVPTAEMPFGFCEIGRCVE